MGTNKVAWACGNCGSTDVETIAYANWDVCQQEWNFAFDNDSESYCQGCGDSSYNDETKYDPVIWDASFEAGDLVTFPDDVVIYDSLHGSSKIPQTTDDQPLVLAMVTDDQPEKSRYGGERDTLCVRLFTGELIEVWPRQIRAYEGPSDE